MKPCPFWTLALKWVSNLWKLFPTIKWDWNLTQFLFFCVIRFTCCLLKSLTSILFIFCKTSSSQSWKFKRLLTKNWKFWVVGSLRYWKQKRWFSKDFDSQLKMHWNSNLPFLLPRPSVTFPLCSIQTCHQT